MQADVRKNLVEAGLISGMLSLPSNMFSQSPCQRRCGSSRRLGSTTRSFSSTLAYLHWIANLELAHRARADIEEPGRFAVEYAASAQGSENGCGKELPVASAKGPIGIAPALFAPLVPFAALASNFLEEAAEVSPIDGAKLEGRPQDHDRAGVIEGGDALELGAMSCVAAPLGEKGFGGHKKLGRGLVAEDLEISVCADVEGIDALIGNPGLSNPYADKHMRTREYLGSLIVGGVDEDKI
jgi:hypothetical protein